MIAGVGDPSAASSLANIFLSQLGGARRGRVASGLEQVEPSRNVRGVEGKSELSEEEKRQVEELEKRDREVRRHESAHKAAAGQFATGGPQLEFSRGPDGKQYATGGEVQIDTSEIPGDPQATISKMQQIRRAATAPAHPSGQDRRVAAQAARIEARAKTELGDQSGDASTSATSSGFAQSIASFFSDTRNTGSFVDVRV